jgi:ATP diphosphatase
MERPDPHSVLEVLQTLLGPNGCPWDREQTPESLCDYLIEEVFELIEAVRTGHQQQVRDELGDAFFLLFFLALLLARRYGFSLNEVWQHSAAKMISRHPHVFGEASFSNRDELLQSWEAVKRKERQGPDGQGKGPDPMASIPASLPPLLRAYRIHSKAAKLGFSWSCDADQDRALKAEWREWEEAKAAGGFHDKEEELGDLLFSLVEQGRRQGVKANAALHEANRKFLSRFQGMLELARERGLDWEALDSAAKNELWEEIKRSGARRPDS